MKRIFSVGRGSLPASGGSRRAGGGTARQGYDMNDGWLRAQEGAPGFLWVVIIAATIIAQVVKLFRRARPQQPSAPPATGEQQAPQDELSEFLRQLTGAPQRPPSAPAPTPAAAPPAPPPVPEAPKAAAARPVERPRRAAARRVQSVAPTRPIAPAEPQPAASMDDDAYKAHRRSGMASALQLQVLGMVRDKNGLRQAVLLREILGPPRAVRPPGMQAG